MIWSENPRIEIFNSDCMEGLKEFKDNQFDLAIVDPPYGIGVSNHDTFGHKTIVAKNSFLKKAIKPKLYKKSEWDNKTPNKYYFMRLNDVSEKQVIWGINYFNNVGLNNGGRLFWDKFGPGNYSRGELAYLSFVNRVEYYQFRWCGMVKQNNGDNDNRFHPTQKPVALYKWLLKNYAKEGNTILDTHLGSGSIAIACYDMGFSLTGFEIDTDYYEASYKRFKNHIAQLQLFK